jgi:hypothetical protein
MFLQIVFSIGDRGEGVRGQFGNGVAVEGRGASFSCDRFRFRSSVQTGLELVL